MGISTINFFELIDPKSRSNSYPSLVSRPWGKKMKVNISLDKDIIKIMEKEKRS